MSEEKGRRGSFSTFLTGSQYETQPETLQVRQKPGKLFIGIPKEDTLQENRVALVPSSIATLVAHGHRIVVESNAGEKSNFSDHDFAEAKADIVFSK